MHTIPQEKQIQIIKVIEIFFTDAKIYLFGSRAKNTHAVTSDIDIAIDAGNPMDMSKRGQINFYARCFKYSSKYRCCRFSKSSGSITSKYFA